MKNTKLVITLILVLINVITLTACGPISRVVGEAGEQSIDEGAKHVLLDDILSDEDLKLCTKIDDKSSLQRALSQYAGSLTKPGQIKVEYKKDSNEIGQMTNKEAIEDLAKTESEIYEKDQNSKFLIEGYYDDRELDCDVEAIQIPQVDKVQIIFKYIDNDIEIEEETTSNTEIDTGLLGVWNMNNSTGYLYVMEITSNDNVKLKGTFGSYKSIKRYHLEGQVENGNLIANLYYESLEHVKEDIEKTASKESLAADAEYIYKNKKDFHYSILIDLNSQQLKDGNLYFQGFYYYWHIEGKDNIPQQKRSSDNWEFKKF